MESQEGLVLDKLLHIQLMAFSLTYFLLHLRLRNLQVLMGFLQLHLSFRFHFEDNLNEYNEAVFDNGQNNIAFNLDVFKALEHIKADIIYMDPPYAGTMNDYYGFYGLLDSYITGSVIEPFDNNFIDKKTIIEQFDKLFGKLKNFRYWMLSYNSRSKPSKEELLQLLYKYSDNVVVHEMPYAYRVTGKEKKKKDIEYLFIAHNPIGK